MPRIPWDYACPHCQYNLRGLEQRQRCPECGQVYDATLPRSRSRHITGLSTLDRICAVLAIFLAIPLMILGLLGLFTGCRANFSLPPVLGVIPALIAWGIFRSVIVAWRASDFVDAAAALAAAAKAPSIYRDPLPPSVAPIDREIDRMHDDESAEQDVRHDEGSDFAPDDEAPDGETKR